MLLSPILMYFILHLVNSIEYNAHHSLYSYIQILINMPIYACVNINYY